MSRRVTQRHIHATICACDVWLLGIVRGSGIERRGHPFQGPKMKNPFKYFKTSPETIPLAVMK